VNFSTLTRGEYAGIEITGIVLGSVLVKLFLVTGIFLVVGSF
jgi:hypothetical protein